MGDRIWGKRAVIEALRSDVPIERILMADNLEHDGLVKDILRKAEQKGLSLTLCPKRKLDSFGGERKDVVHQGVIAEVSPFAYAPLAALFEDASRSCRERGGRALAVICDHITDAGNLGAIARSAESVGASGLIIPNARSAQVTPVTYKTSAGAIAHMNICQVPNLQRTIAELKDEGFWVVGATEHGEDLLWDMDLKGKIALVMGNEHEGVSRLVLERCDMLCRLPQEGAISSLNVAQASTVFMYEWLRQNMMA